MTSDNERDTLIEEYLSTGISLLAAVRGADAQIAYRSAVAGRQGVFVCGEGSVREEDDGVQVIPRVRDGVDIADDGMMSAGFVAPERRDYSDIEGADHE